MFCDDPTLATPGEVRHCLIVLVVSCSSLKRHEGIMREVQCPQLGYSEADVEIYILNLIGLIHQQDIMQYEDIDILIYCKASPADHLESLNPTSIIYE